jgi:hypothetical protein
MQFELLQLYREWSRGIASTVPPAGGHAYMHPATVCRRAGARLLVTTDVQRNIGMLSASGGVWPVQQLQSPAVAVTSSHQLLGVFGLFSSCR